MFSGPCFRKTLNAFVPNIPKQRKPKLRLDNSRRFWRSCQTELSSDVDMKAPTQTSPAGFDLSHLLVPLRLTGFLHWFHWDR